MEIRFSGEDKDGARTEFASWRELAEAAPWALLDVDSLTSAQREHLVAEFEKLALPQEVRTGAEYDLLPPSEYLSEPLERFAIRNLRRLLPGNDTLVLAEQQAVAFLEERIGKYSGLRKTFVKRVGKDAKNWRAVDLEGAGKVECEPLVSLYELDLAPRLSPLWHAVRLLSHAHMARISIEAGDAAHAVKMGIAVGESRRALGNVVGKAAEGAKGPRVRENGNAERNSWVVDQVEKMSGEKKINEKISAMTERRENGYRWEAMTDGAVRAVRRRHQKKG